MKSGTRPVGHYGQRILCLILMATVLLMPAVSIAASPQPGDYLRVYVITMGPGADPWEKFGHDCIEIVDFRDGTDAAYNWGVFSFGQGVSGFVSFGVQFLRGRLNYSMESDPTERMVYAYASAGRSVLRQEMDLPADAKIALETRLRANDTDANRYYLYDYYQKNCATMVRDQIDQAAGGAVRKSLETVPTGTTYRYHNNRLSADQLWLYAFLYYSLGHFVDRPISAWQESFLPGKLAAHLRTIRITGPDGRPHPLVKREQTISPSSFPERDAPPNQWPKSITAAVVWGGLLICLSLLGRRYRVSRWCFVLLGMGWSLLAGLMGALMTYAWFSNHVAAQWNENWLAGNPLSLLLVVMLPLAWKWPRQTFGVASLVLLLALADVAAKITPWEWQSNGLVLTFAVITHAAVLAGLWPVRKPAGITTP